MKFLHGYTVNVFVAGNFGAVPSAGGTMGESDDNQD